MNKFFFLSIIFLMALAACNGKQKAASHKTVTDFYKALKQGDSLEMKKHYPDFEKLGGHYKSDWFTILQTEETEDGLMEVRIKNNFKNIAGEKFKQEIRFYCKEDPKKPGKFIIKDSKGLYGFKESREYQFAVKTGFIQTKNELTDQETAAKILKSQELLEVLFKEKIESLRKEIVIENWSWEYGYVNTYANGHGRVVNRSNEDFRTLKYSLTFVDDEGKITKTDEGYLGYDTLKAGTSRDFTTMTSDIGGAVKAYIQVQFDTYELLDQIYDAKYSGNEYRLLK